MKFIAIIIAFSSLFLTACSSLHHHTPSVVGRWSQDSGFCIWEFRSDGTVHVHGNDGSLERGRYALLGGDRIALDFGPSLKMSVVEGIVVSEKQLTLIPDKGEKCVLDRVQ